MVFRRYYLIPVVVSHTSYIPTGMAFQKVSDQTRVATINSISAVPEFKIALDKLIPLS